MPIINNLCVDLITLFYMPMKKVQESPKNLNANIIEYCQENFINILPNTRSKEGPNESQAARNLITHEKEQIQTILRQFSIFLQLVIQNCVLTCDPKVKSQSYRILGIFRNLLSRDLDDFENIANHRSRVKLPFYDVDCKDFLGRQMIVKIPPQVSLYADPLLFYIYSKLAQEQLFCSLPIMRTREERIEIIKRHVPFLNPNFIPIVGERFETKAKFSEFEDRLLLIMLSLHKKRDITHFKHIYFPKRQQTQIKNRAKNLCAKELSNPIKKMRENEYLGLTEREIKTLVKAYRRYSGRWSVIAKYYCLRSPQMLEAQFEQCPKLLKLRKSYNVRVNYPPIHEILAEQISKHAESDAQKQQQGTHQLQNFDTENHQGQPLFLPIYKVINHLTFLYQEI